MYVFLNKYIDIEKWLTTNFDSIELLRSFNKGPFLPVNTPILFASVTYSPYIAVMYQSAKMPSVNFIATDEINKLMDLVNYLDHIYTLDDYDYTLEMLIKVVEYSTMLKRNLSIENNKKTIDITPILSRKSMFMN